MTLELNQVAPQVKAMGLSLAQQQHSHDETLTEARALLTACANNRDELLERIAQAEKVQQQQRFDWLGAAPTAEVLNQAYPLPSLPERVTVIASDGSQIYPDPHAITLYYLINVGSIVYRHGSQQKPQPYNPKPILRYDLDDILDAQGFLIPTGKVNVQRDLAELDVLVSLAPAYGQLHDEPVVALLDGQLALRVIDLPFNEQEQHQELYIDKLNLLRENNIALGSYIDRPRSTFVLALLHLGSLSPGNITEETLRQNPFRRLTDLDIFDFLEPGQRSAIFTSRAKGIEKYGRQGHAIHFFYLNVGAGAGRPVLARIEIPAWVAANPAALDTLHAAVVRQARITGSYPYVLARADELAVISTEEREAVEMMLAIELRRRGFNPQISLKQRNKNAYRAGKESFKL